MVKTSGLELDGRIFRVEAERRHSTLIDHGALMVI